MSAGTGIFLAGLAIAFALLLWNPDTRRIVGTSLKWIVAIAIIAGLGLWAYLSYEDHIHRTGRAPTDNPQLAGIKLGDSRNDVIYKKGKPIRSVDGDDEYGNTFIYYDNDRVSAVFFSCESDWSTELNGIACKASAEKVKKRFKGKMYCLPDTPTDRIFMVEEFKSIYILQQETVAALGIKSGVGKNWIACD